MSNKDFVFKGKHWSCTILNVPEEHPIDKNRNTIEELQEFCEFLDSGNADYDNGLQVVSRLLDMYYCAIDYYDQIKHLFNARDN